MDMHKVSVLYKKDFKEVVKNPAMFVICIVPLFFALFFSKMGMMDAEGAMVYGMLMNLTMVGILLISSMVAEEKEKYTLRTLMLSNVSALDFLSAKIFVAFTFLTVTNILIYVISGMSMAYLLPYIATTILGGFPVLILSAAIGIQARDQMSTSVLQLPVMFLFLLPPMLGGVNKTFMFIAKIVPTGATLQLFGGFMKDSGFTKNMILNVVVLVAWIGISAFVFAFCYKRKGLDN